MLVSDLTQKWIVAYLANPTTTLLISTNDNPLTGKDIAEYIHRKLCPENNNYLLTYESDGKTIGVEQIRVLQKQIRMQADTGQDVSRMLAVYDAHTMTVEAQNALLKTLEETSARTRIMLVARSEKELLPTIRSRSFVIKIQPINATAAKKLAQDYSINPSDFSSIYAMSEGWPDALIPALKGEKDNHAIQTVKAFLSATPFHRQEHVKQIIKNGNVDSFLKNIKLVCIAAMRNAKDLNTKKQWSKRVKLVSDSELMLKSQVQTKLVLLHISINL